MTFAAAPFEATMALGTGALLLLPPVQEKQSLSKRSVWSGQGEQSKKVVRALS